MRELDLFRVRAQGRRPRRSATSPTSEGWRQVKETLLQSVGMGGDAGDPRRGRRLRRQPHAAPRPRPRRPRPPARERREDARATSTGSGATRSSSRRASTASARSSRSATAASRPKPVEVAARRAAGLAPSPGAVAIIAGRCRSTSTGDGDCRRKVTVLTLRVSERVDPVCEHCGSRELTACMSRFAHGPLRGQPASTTSPSRRGARRRRRERPEEHGPLDAQDGQGARRGRRRGLRRDGRRARGRRRRRRRRRATAATTSGDGATSTRWPHPDRPAPARARRASPGPTCSRASPTASSCSTPADASTTLNPAAELLLGVVGARRPSATRSSDALPPAREPWLAELVARHAARGASPRRRAEEPLFASGRTRSW